MEDVKTVERRKLWEAPIDDLNTAGLIDGFYTEFDIAEEDRSCLERFLSSSVLEVRREALIALIFSTGRDGPKFTGYARDGLILHALGIVEDSEAMYTGVDILGALANRGDQEALAILESLERNDKWRRQFGEVRLRPD